MSHGQTVRDRVAGFPCEHVLCFGAIVRVFYTEVEPGCPGRVGRSAGHSAVYLILKSYLSSF